MARKADEDMTEDLTRTVRRWQAAEAAADDDAADAAFAAVYQASISAPLPSRELVPRTMAAVADAAAVEARRARRVRSGLLWLGLPAGAVLLYLSAGTLVSLLSSAVVGCLNLLVSLVVLFAGGSDVRRALWSVLSGLGRATATFVADPRVTLAMVVCQAVAIAALVALHRLLGPGREWLR
jgi:hypothetical protein